MKFLVAFALFYIAAGENDGHQESFSEQLLQSPKEDLDSQKDSLNFLFESPKAAVFDPDFESPQVFDSVVESLKVSVFDSNFESPKENLDSVQPSKEYLLNFLRLPKDSLLDSDQEPPKESPISFLEPPNALVDSDLESPIDVDIVEDPEVSDSIVEDPKVSDSVLEAQKVFDSDAEARKTAYDTPVEIDYHNNVGIPAARRIKAVEEALDFDGARIVGGNPASLGQYPYMGGLVITLTNGWTSVCGSSLLSHTRAVTAAHCWRTVNNQASWFTVVLGSTRLFSGGTRVDSNDVEMHISYNMFSLVNDIAIIRLRWIAFNNHIQPIGLASSGYQYVGTWAWAAGFGHTRDGLPISNYQYLSHVTVHIITNAQCAGTYGTNTVVYSTICASTTHGGGTCGGDSGGPLIAWNQQQGWHLIGVVSFGHVQGCQFGHPVGFARVSSFVNWIRARL